MDTRDIQQHFFTYLKASLPTHLSMVDELCDLLNVSADSAYRRIRGEKQLSLAELKLISDKYKISIDQVLQLQSGTVLFQAPAMEGGDSSFRDYLEGILHQLRYMNGFGQKEFWYLCKDAVFWQFYYYPEIASFKTFFWRKSIRNEPALESKQFSLAEFPYHECFEIGQNICREYNRIPGSELWNLESFNSTINQIQFYRDAGIFRSREDLELTVDSFLKMLEHLQKQTEKGMKFMPGAGEAGYGASFRFYINEVILGNNNMIVELDGVRTAYINYKVLEYIITKDTGFIDHVLEGYRTLESKATLISGTGEKDRNRFFRLLREKIEVLRS